MADTNNLFLKFDNKIKLTKAKTDSLKTSREALRKTIKNWFDEQNKQQPSFCWQGSFAMKTTVNPLYGGEYDLDDGIYLAGYSDLEIDNWPATSTVHNWIKVATDTQTLEDTIDKDTCIRVKYSSEYHIDIPIYIIKNDIAYLAHKSKGWIQSDPKAFKNWFIGNVSDNGEQLRRIVRYLKAWKDNKSVSLKGIELTILASDNFDVYDDRDDKSLRNTVENIINTLENSFSCVKPVIPNEDLFENFSETKISLIKSSLNSFKGKLDNAINEVDEEKASEYLKKVFGDRFPKGEETDIAYVNTAAPGVLKHDGRSGR